MSRHTNRGTIFLTESKYDSLRCKGDVKAEGNISADSVNIKGSLNTSHDITAESEFDFKGRISAGNVTAPDVKIITGSDGHAGDISGGNIFIRCGIDPAMTEEFVNIATGILKLFHVDGTEIRKAAEESALQKKEAPVFTCGEISGNDVELFGVTCRSVSGRNITLRENCHVDRVIYTGNFTADDSCIVGKTEKA